MKALQARPRTLSVLMAVLAVIGAYLIFEFGRYQAGYSLFDHDRDVERLRRMLSAQKADLEDSERQLAILKTSREVDRQTYTQVEATLAELETKLQAQEEELEFYRGIVSPAAGEAGLRVQNLQIRPGASERRYSLQLVLIQSIAHNRRVEGVVRLRIGGTRDGEPVELALKDVGGAEGTSELEYGFRYFQALEQELELPLGFAPETIEVEISPSAPKADTTTQTFKWSAITVAE